MTIFKTQTAYDTAAIDIDIDVKGCTDEIIQLSSDPELSNCFEILGLGNSAHRISSNWAGKTFGELRRTFRAHRYGREV